MARPSVEQGQRTDEGRGLVPSRRWVEAEGQVFAPMTPILFGEPGAPGREGGKLSAAKVYDNLVYALSINRLG